MKTRHGERLTFFMHAMLFQRRAVRLIAVRTANERWLRASRQMNWSDTAHLDQVRPSSTEVVFGVAEACGEKRMSGLSRKST